MSDQAARLPEEADGGRSKHRSDDRDDRRKDTSRRDRSRSRSRSRDRKRKRSDSHSSSSDSGDSGSSRSRSRDRHSRKHKRHRKDRSRSRSRSRDRRRHRSPSRSRSRSRSKDRKKEKKHKRERSRSRSRSRDRARPGDAAAAAAPAAAAAAVEPSREARKRSKKEKDESAARIASLFGYTAENNPFGDSDLTATFTWKKKVDKDIAAGKAQRAPTADEQARVRDELMEEVERAKARRAKREAEKEEMERLRAEEARLRDASQYEAWESKEEEFHLLQAKNKALIRMREAREQPSDEVVKNLLLFDAAESIAAGRLRDREAEALSALLAVGAQLEQPLDIIQRLSPEYLSQVEQAVKGFQELEGDRSPNADFWRCLLVVVADEQRRASARQAGIARGTSLAALQAVEDEVDAMFDGKSERDLQDMLRDISGVIDRGSSSSSSASSSSSGVLALGPARGAAVDVEYWLGVQSNCKIALAKATLRRIHEEQLLLRLMQLQAASAVASGSSSGSSYRTPTLPQSLTLPAMRDTVAAMEERKRLLETAVGSLVESGLLQPPGKTRGGAGGAGGGAGGAGGDGDVDEAVFTDASGRQLPSGVGEADMGADAEVAVAGGLSARDAAALADKYMPRKPRYFNRVKTGYDWNRYNQTHYDKENPPPKTVQGYKFNVFYPDLLDKTKTPSFKLEPADSDEYVLIRFHGGPPYEDVAFKIVNREWEFGRRAGFKCVFDRGILQLYFNFKRYRYRK